MRYLAKFIIECDDEDIEQVVADMKSEIQYDNAICHSDSIEKLKEN